jgi:hypothetical protein
MCSVCRRQFVVSEVAALLLSSSLVSSVVLALLAELHFVTARPLIMLPVSGKLDLVAAIAVSGYRRSP